MIDINLTYNWCDSCGEWDKTHIIDITSDKTNENIEVDICDKCIKLMIQKLKQVVL